MKTTKQHPLYGAIEATKKVADSSQIRSQRRDQKKREKKRQSLYAGMDTFALTEALISGRISGPDALAIHYGNLAVARKVLRRIQIEQGIGARGNAEQPKPAKVGNLQAPRHELREGNLPNFRVWLVEVEPPLFNSQEEFIAEWRARIKAGARPHQLVDLLASRTPTSWPQARELVRQAFNQPDLISDDMLQCLKDGRRFWRGARLLRRQYMNAAAAGFLRPYEGNWIILPNTIVPNFLPGLRIPKMHERGEYLVRLTMNEAEKLVMLDFYSIAYLPLFRASV
jgi:hypothetical protein